MKMKNCEIRREIIRSIGELKYKGFEVDTFFDKTSEFHQEAYLEVLYEVLGNIVEEVLDEAEVKLSDSYFGNLAYNIIVENVREKALNLVQECINDLFLNK